MKITNYREKCEKEFKKNLLLGVVIFLLPLFLLVANGEYYLATIMESKIVLHFCHFLQTVIPSIFNLILLVTFFAIILTIQAGLLKSFYHFLRGITIPSNMKPYISRIPAENNGNLRRVDNFKVIEIDSQVPFALAEGIINKNIVVSNAMKKLLSSEELEAVLFHEAGHLKMNHPLKRLLVNSISHALYIIPSRREIYGKFKVQTELAADEFAVMKGVLPDVLAGAIVKVAREEHTGGASPSVGFTDSQVKKRIFALLGVNEETKGKMNEKVHIFRKILKTVPVVLFVLFLMQPFIHIPDGGYCMATTRELNHTSQSSNMLSVCTEFDCKRCDICSPAHREHL